MQESQSSEIGKLQGGADEGKGIGDVSQGVGALVGKSVPSEAGRVGGAPDPEGVHDEEDDSFHPAMTRW